MVGILISRCRERIADIDISIFFTYVKNCECHKNYVHDVFIRLFLKLIIIFVKKKLRYYFKLKLNYIL